MNLVKIATACAVECERQQVGIVELGYLLEAYDHIYHYGLRTIGDFIGAGRKIEPVKNCNAYRITPVTFANGGSSASAPEISRLMKQLAEAIADFQHGNYNFVSKETSVGILVKELLWIHPFQDGNGRLAFLLWNYLMGTLDEPLALPDFGW